VTHFRDHALKEDVSPLAGQESGVSMYGMPLAQALVFLAAVIVIIGATQWRHFHPFIVITIVASVFGFIAGFPTSFLGKLFGTGFSEMFYSPGLVIVAAAFIAGLAESTAASDQLTAALDRWRGHWPWLGSNRIAAALGLIAGIGASPAAAFALLTPALPALGGGTPQTRQGAVISLALAISASHGLLWLTPVPIAAAAILGAPWSRVALFGLPVAVLAVASGALFARRSSPVAAATAPPQAAPQPAAEIQSGGSAIVLVLAMAVPLLLLMVQSLGDMPSEPLGGGPARELIIGVGRPLILFLIGVGIMVIGQPRNSINLLADSAWTGRMIANVSSILLIVCAAGGLQKLCQETGMAEMFADRLLEWHVEVFGAVLVAFVIAAAIKTLQGSSLVAAITAAGMMQPMLLPLGPDGANAKALAALAVGAGAMTISHVNDEYFWLVTNSAGLPPLRGLTTLSVGTLLQGLIAAAILLLLSVLISHT
jgi:gluconate:H+ symporter, GntP family